MRPLVPGIVANAHDFMLAKEVAEALVKAYPDWLWNVSVSLDHSMLYVIESRLAGRKQIAFSIKVNDLDYDLGRNLTRRAVNAGGELLERAGFRRGRFDAEKFAALPKTFLGDVMLDVSDKEGATFKKLARVWDVCKKAAWSAVVKA